ncbi:MAG TPA: DNA repair protein RecO [Gaiellaceae bacterium]|nr:DNA repair protein RecO [Gaiellaceae bacterium]
MAGRAYSTEAVVLRSIRLGEADRVLHLYTRANGRVGAVAKGVRKTLSRFGGRLELLSHVDLILHRGRSDLETVTGVQLVDSHHDTREDYYRFSVGMIGAEAMLRLFPEQEANERAFGAVTRFLELLDETPHTAVTPTVDPLGLAFQLKLLWLSGYLPHVSGCAECGAVDEPLIGYSPKAGGAVCARCAVPAEALALSADGVAGITALLARPLADAVALGLTERARRDALRVITASYEHHGGFRLRTLSA